MTHLPDLADTRMQPQINRCPLRLLAIVLAVILLGICSLSQAQTKAPAARDEISNPDVLILVLSGTGPWDQVSVNYAAEVSVADVRKDILALANDYKWIIKNERASTALASIPGAKPTTSMSFQTPRIVNADSGLLPIEPFITTFKRFKSMEIVYLTGSEFRFRGLKNFDNEYVNIRMKQSSGSYRYRIEIKDNEFERLGLPQREVKQDNRQRAPMSAGVRVMLSIGLALAVAVVAYLIAAHFTKSRKPDSEGK